MNQPRIPVRLSAFCLALGLSPLSLGCAVAQEETSSDEEFEAPDDRATSGKYGVPVEEVDVSEYELGEIGDSLERIVVNSAECGACADDEWGAYVRKCCITTNNGKACWQEACKKPVEEDLPLDPGDSGDPPTSAPHDPILFPSFEP